MRRPTWVTVISILGIIFGCFGILGGGQEIVMPKMMKMQKEMFAAMEQQQIQSNKDNQTESGINQDNNVRNNRVIPNPAMFKTMEKMFDVPDWFEGWSIFTGSAKALISAFYLFASIWLIQLKPRAIRLFYCALGSSIFLSLLKAGVALYAFSFMSMMMTMGGLFGALIDVVLIVVVAISDKSAFNKHQELDDKSDVRLPIVPVESFSAIMSGDKPDYANYSEEKLRQVLTRIDKERFPDRVREIESRLTQFSNKSNPQ